MDWTSGRQAAPRGKRFANRMLLQVELERRDCQPAIAVQEVRVSGEKDNYTRTVFDMPVKGGLNGDTTVRSYLDIKTKFAKPPDSDAELWDLVSMRRRAYFNITEDDRIDEYDSKEPRSVEDEVSHLLYTPLPADLPTMDKDLLIQMAAYYGNINRYSRLRRPIGQ